MNPLKSLFENHKALVLFDCETSGLDPDKHQIIELAAMRIEETPRGALRIADQMDTFIKLPDGEKLPPEVVELTGITDAKLLSEGVNTHKLANAIIAYNLTDKVQNSHRAIDDVLAMFEVMKAMAEERDDLATYINLFGYNPKYGVSGRRIPGIRYEAQNFNNIMTRPEQTLPARVAAKGAFRR